jgi:hypothetical protein
MIVRVSDEVINSSILADLLRCYYYLAKVPKILSGRITVLPAKLDD